MYFSFLEVIKIVRKILLSISLKIFFCFILFLENTDILTNYLALFDEGFFSDQKTFTASNSAYATV